MNPASSLPPEGLPPQPKNPAMPYPNGPTPSPMPAAMPPEVDMASPSDLQNLPPQQAVELLLTDPVGFVKSIVDSAAKVHLSDLKEEAELRGILAAFRKNNPDYARFEPFILQEVVLLLEQDPDAATDPWDKLLEKATDAFKQKFSQVVEEEKQKKEHSALPLSEPPYVEGAANRTVQPTPSHFTREQIARMSMAEFLANEAAINDALTHNRIQ